MEPNKSSFLVVTASFLRPKKHLLKVGPIELNKIDSKQLYSAMKNISEVSVEYYERFSKGFIDFMLSQSKEWKGVVPNDNTGA